MTGDRRDILGVELSPDQVAFREALRGWLDANHPGEEPADEATAFAFRRDWQRRLHDAGYMGLTWPREYGGQGLTPTEQAIFNDELVSVRAPRPANLIGLEMGGPTILSHGTEAHKRRYLPPLLSGEEIWCQAFSEPQAGSDLAALRTSATRHGDEWVVTGQKLWTSFAHEARWCMLLARSDPSSTGHAGLTYLLLDMDQPGVRVRGLRQLTGDAEFNEVFLQEARVPVAETLGAPGEGWRVAVTTLMHERANLGFSLAVDVRLALEELIELVHATRRDGNEMADEPLLRDRLAQLEIETQILEVTALDTLLGVADGTIPGPRASLVKWRWAEVNQAINELALDVLGAASDPTWSKRWLRSRANSIEGGTTEVLKNIVAERVLGLPRAR